MTHVLITDLREIRYMAYVPEVPEYHSEAWYKKYSESHNFNPEQEYQKDLAALEKAKRESIEFDRPEDNSKIKWLVTDWINPELKPGIYQVPVEVEVRNLGGNCPRWDKIACSCKEICDVKKVARIKSSEPKEKNCQHPQSHRAYGTHGQYDQCAKCGEYIRKPTIVEEFLANKPKSQEELWMQVAIEFDRKTLANSNDYKSLFSRLTEKFEITRKRG